jgi:hypothetical protein
MLRHKHLQGQYKPQLGTFFVWQPIRPKLWSFEAIASPLKVQLVAVEQGVQLEVLD